MLQEACGSSNHVHYIWILILVPWWPLEHVKGCFTSPHFSLWEVKYITCTNSQWFWVQSHYFLCQNLVFMDTHCTSDWCCKCVDPATISTISEFSFWCSGNPWSILRDVSPALIPIFGVIWGDVRNSECNVICERWSISPAQTPTYDDSECKVIAFFARIWCSQTHAVC